MMRLALTAGFVAAVLAARLFGPWPAILAIPVLLAVVLLTTETIIESTEGN